MTKRITEAGRPTQDMLVKRIRARDVAAFEELYRAYHARLFRFLSNLLRRPHLVEEVLSDTMMVVWTRIETFAGESRLSTWMFGIAYRQGLSALRRLDEPVDGEQAVLAGDPAAGPDQATDRTWARRELASAIERLSAPHRAVINLTYHQELGYREIAEIMDCPVDTVKTRMFHARRYLKQALSGDLADWL